MSLFCASWHGLPVQHLCSFPDNSFVTNPITSSLAPTLPLEFGLFKHLQPARLNSGLMSELSLCRMPWFALNPLLAVLSPSALLELSLHFFFCLSHRLIYCPSPSSRKVNSWLFYCSHFVSSRGGSGKLWRVQSWGRGSEEHRGWQLLVHEQTVGRHPGKLVCTFRRLKWFDFDS